MLTQAVKKSMDQSVLCWLATSSADAHPNVSPKEIFTYYGEDIILIANIASPNSLRNIKVNPKVCVSFIDILVQKGFQVKGHATIVTKEVTNFSIYHDLLYQIAGPNFPFSSLFEVKIEQVKPIIAPKYILFPDTTEAAQIESAKRLYKLEE